MVGLLCFLYNWELLLVFFLGWWWGFWWMFVMNRSSLYCGRIRIESLWGILRLSTILLCPKGECPVSSGGAFIIIVYDFDFSLLRYFLCLWFPPDVFVALEQTKRKFNEHIFNLSKFDGCDERERERAVQPEALQARSSNHGWYQQHSLCVTWWDVDIYNDI